MIVYRLAQILFTLYFRLLNRLVIRGRENEIPEGPVIVYGNHVSDLDIFLLAITFRRQIRFMGKKSLFETPVVRRFAKWFGAFPVDRQRADLTAVKTALRILRAGDVLGIFPEGTRVVGGKVSDPKGGIAMFAWKTGAKMIPVHITYRRKCKVFNSIRVTVGTPISPEELPIRSGSAEEFKAAGEYLLDRVYTL